LKDLPEIEPALKNGELSLSNASALQHFFRNEEKSQGKAYSQAKKVDLVEELKNRSRRECDELLTRLSPEQPHREFSKPTAAGGVEVRLHLDFELAQKLEKLKVLLSHRCPNPTWAELIEILADVALKKLDPELKTTKSLAPVAHEPNSLPPAELKRHIPQALKAAVWKRDRGRCTFVTRDKEVRCDSHHRIEFHHIRDFALGGNHSLENLTLLCKTHNRHAAIETFGHVVMDRYLGHLR
ncbi:MAG: HNH endonuclease signature motif containing protein, partial [Bdellovibrionota bacterium]